MRSEPLVAYPIVRVAFKPVQSLFMDALGVPVGDQASLYESVLLRRSVEQLPVAFDQSIGRASAALASEGWAQAQELIDAFGYGFGELGAELGAIKRAISQGLDKLNETVTAGFSELATLGESTVRHLDAIEKLLERPLDTTARELRQRALQAYRWGLFEEAEADFEKSVSANPYDHVSHLHMGHIRLMEGRTGEAEGSYRKAARYALAPPKGDPARAIDNGAFALMNLARALTEVGETDDAFEAAQSARQLRPDRPDVLYEYARVAVLADRPDKAEPAWRRCLEIAAETFLPVALAETQVQFPIAPLADLYASQADLYASQRERSQTLARARSVLEELSEDEPTLRGRDLPPADDEGQQRAIASLRTSNDDLQTALNRDAKKKRRALQGRVGVLDQQISRTYVSISRAPLPTSPVVPRLHQRAKGEGHV